MLDKQIGKELLRRRCSDGNLTGSEQKVRKVYKTNNVDLFSNSESVSEIKKTSSLMAHGCHLLKSTWNVPKFGPL